MLGLTLDRNAPMTLGRQLTEALRSRIRSGELAGGVRLPASRPLAEDLDVSRSVVVEAYEQLQAEGYLEGRRGSGCYVAAGARIADRPARDRIRDRRPDRPGPGCIRFDTGLPALDLIPWHAWGKALKEAAPVLARVGYGDPEGLPDLREALAAYLHRARGLRVAAEDVFVTSGSTQSLALLARLCCDPARAALLEDPCHTAMRELLRVAGVPILAQPVDGQGLRVDDLPEIRGGLAYVTPSHQFPLGGVLPAARRARLVAWARDRGVLVLEDDYDGEFRYGGPPLLPLRESDPDGVAFAATFSKTFSPGLRLGCVVLPAGLRSRWRELKFYTDVHCPSLDQAALARFLASGRMEQHVHRMRKVYATRRAALLEALDAAFPGRIQVSGAAAGLHVAVRFPGVAFTRECLRRLQDAGVRVQPVEGHALGHREAWRDTVLMGYGNLAEREIRQGVRRLRVGLGSGSDPTGPDPQRVAAPLD